MYTKPFFDALAKRSVKLDSDIEQHVRGVTSFATDKASLRRSTEPYLADAGMSLQDIEDFFTDMPQDRAPVKPKAAKATKANIKEIPKVDKPTKSVDAPKTAAKATKKDKTDSKTTVKETPRTVTPAVVNQEPTIVAISQQSRFHTETTEVNSTEIDLKQVNLQVNDRELLCDAKLRLKAGVRYGFVGPNGAGKSTLMKAIGHNVLIGLPQNVTFLYVDQLEVNDTSLSVVETVLEADKERKRIIAETNALQGVVNVQKDAAHAKASEQLNEVVHHIRVQRAADDLKSAQRIAAHRSGARGWDARADLLKQEQTTWEIESEAPGDLSAQIVNDTVTEVLEKFALLDIEGGKAQCRRILKGLGFSDEQQDMPVKKFSGGWRMRVALAQALFMEPNVLLLDEPTNHLDLPAMLWLQNYLVEESPVEQTILIVSHNRDFLTAVTTETIILKDKSLKYHEGNFEDYERIFEEQRVRKQRLKDTMEKKRQHINNSIQNSLSQARSKGDDKMLGQVASRKKKLDRLGMEKTEDGKRFKVSYWAGYHNSMRDGIVVEQGPKAVKITIPNPEPLRQAGAFVQLEDVSFRFPGTTNMTLENVLLNIQPNSRIAFLGPNGCGKSTLIALLAGTNQPTKGLIKRNPRCRIGYFAQHHLDQLDLTSTPLAVMKAAHPEATEKEIRAALGGFGLGEFGSHVIATLSGGQKSRITFCTIAYDCPHLLLLDEITNHLDMQTIDGLVEALQSYEGAVVCVSHDAWFLRKVIEGESLHEDLEEEEDDDEVELRPKGELYVINKGQLKRWTDSMDAYVAKLLKRVTQV